VTLLRVQYISHVPSSGRSSDGMAAILALVTLSALLAAVVLLVKDWRRWRENDAASLVQEVERWLRQQYPP
jgi:hypothetical protein